MHDCCKRPLTRCFAPPSPARREGAREYLRQGQAIMARLTKLSPENAVWRQDLAWFDGEIAALAEE